MRLKCSCFAVKPAKTLPDDILLNSLKSTVPWPSFKFQKSTSVLFILVFVLREGSCGQALLPDSCASPDPPTVVLGTHVRSSPCTTLRGGAGEQEREVHQVRRGGHWRGGCDGHH